MNLNTFTTYILALGLFFFQVFAYFQHHFSGLDELREKVSQLESQIKSEQLKTLVAQQETQEIQQTVATLLPEAVKKEKDPWKSYNLRNLASVVDEPSDDALKIEPASGLFEQARDQFRAKNYAQAAQLFSDLVEKYPDSVHAVEAQFLLAESSYLQHDYSTSVKTIEIMMVRYPENTLTGFALLRLAKIYQENERLEDAAEVLKTVIHSYADKDLVQQAQASLKALQL